MLLETECSARYSLQPPAGEAWVRGHFPLSIGPVWPGVLQIDTWFDHVRNWYGLAFMRLATIDCRFRGGPVSLGSEIMVTACPRQAGQEFVGSLQLQDQPILTIHKVTCQKRGSVVVPAAIDPDGFVRWSRVTVMKTLPMGFDFLILDDIPEIDEDARPMTCTGRLRNAPAWQKRHLDDHRVVIADWAILELANQAGAFLALQYFGENSGMVPVLHRAKGVFSQAVASAEVAEPDISVQVTIKKMDVARRLGQMSARVFAGSVLLYEGEVSAGFIPERDLKQ